jgi:hypothetical protein
MRTTPRWGARAGLGIAAALVVLFLLAQLLLPGIAAQRVRSELARYGEVRSVAISAFPAIELLWGDAQSATMSAASLSMTPTQANELLARSRGVRRIDMRAASVRIGSFKLRDVAWRKRGNELYLNGTLTEADLRAALPGSTGFALLGSNSEGVEMRVSGSLFGVSTSLDVRLSAAEGKLVARPINVPFGGLVKITLLSESHLYVQSIALADSPSAAAGSPVYEASISARLR